MTYAHRRWHLAAWLLLAPLTAVILFLSLAWRSEGLP